LSNVPANGIRLILTEQQAVAKLLSQPQPIYPTLARQARIQGNVVVYAIIDKDGRVSHLQVASGHPLLVQSATEAVKNWRYQPETLDCKPIEFATTITISFRLDN
jgi:protein TonB